MGETMDTAETTKARRKTVGVCHPVFDEEDSDLQEKKWSSDRSGYARRAWKIHGQWHRQYAHRAVLERVIGRKPASTEYCDHINGDRMDNRRSNIRLATWKQNTQNRLPTGKSGKRGVVYHRSSGKWQAQVGHEGKTHYCGLFSTQEAAAEAARLKRRELGFFGEE